MNKVNLQDQGLWVWRGRLGEVTLWAALPPGMGAAQGLCVEPAWVWPRSCVLPTAQRLGSLPGNTQRKTVSRGGDQPKPRTQVPPVQGQNGRRNLSAMRGETLILWKFPFTLLSKLDLYMPCGLNMRHMTHTIFRCPDHR